MSQWFGKVRGHRDAKQLLRRGVESGRLSGSFLLCGPAGVGRSLLARELAMAANCLGEQPDAPRPCRSCGPCHRIETGVSGDFLLVQPEGKPSIGIDQIQDLLRELALAPVECRQRVFVLDPAGAMSEPAQNALLKGLEEPPANALLLLIAERTDELLSTIVSRCRLVKLGELEAEQVIEILAEHGVAREEAEARARWCGGSPGDALQEDAAELARLAGEIAAAFASGAAHDDPMATVELLTEFVGTGKAPAAVQRERIQRAVGFLLRTLRDAIVRREGAPAAGSLSGARPDLLDPLASLPAGRLEAAVDALAKVEDEVTRNLNTKFLLDGLVLDVGQALRPASPEPTRA